MEKYQVIKEKFIEEINSQAKLLKHIKSGARILLLSNDDNNKVFQIGFRTPPTDDTGLPHILEHSTLCGSQKFPVKDPFIELLKGSLNTFLNAMTYPDKTVYPVASCNDKDFANLMEVYMDAVFYPNVYKYEEIFKQEGWHYELENADAPIIYNGVVYNEMKGAFSSPEQVVMRASMHGLFPDTPYGVESGGDPDFIPELSYQDFVNFHRRYYHPSNSYIALYGDMDMEEKLEWLDKEYLSKFDEITVDSKLPMQEGFTEPKTEEIFYPIGKEESLEGKTYYSYNATIGTYEDTELAIAFQILSYVLLDAPGAPLKQRLIDAKIGKDIMSNFDSGLLQPMFNIIAKDADSNKISLFKEIINTALKDIVSNGIDKKSLKSALNYFDFKYREGDFGYAPKGLMYILNAMESWLYDENRPFDRLQTNAIFESLQAKVETNYFEGLIEKYLINNNHVAYIICSPSNTLNDEKSKALEEKLAKYKASLSKEEIDKLVADTKALKEYQATPSRPEDIEKIPLLTRKDIKETVEPLVNRVDEVGGVKVLKHDLFTNGIGYLTFHFNTLDVPNRLIPYIGLLTNVLGYVDTSKYPYDDLSKEILMNTGGISASPSVIKLKDNDLYASLDITTRALYNKVPFVFEILTEIINNSKLDDKKRLYEIIAMNKSRRQMSILGRGHVVAASRALSYYSKAQKYSDLVDGISQYSFIEDLEANFDAKFDEIVANLKEAMKYIFRKENLIIDCTADNDDYKDHVFDFVNSLYQDKVNPERFAFTIEKKNEGLKTSSQVQFCGKAGNYLEVGEYNGALLVLGMALRYDYLWTQIRVLGGAYGCLCEFNRYGDVYLGSYRDPNLERTIKVFDEIVEYIDKFNPDERDIMKYIIGAIGTLDTPLNAKAKGARGFRAYIQGLKDTDFQKERNEVLNVTVEQIKGLKPLIAKALSDNALCVIGNENKIEENKEMFKTIANLYK